MAKISPKRNILSCKLEITAGKPGALADLACAYFLLFKFTAVVLPDKTLTSAGQHRFPPLWFPPCSRDALCWLWEITRRVDPKQQQQQQQH